MCWPRLWFVHDAHHISHLLVLCLIFTSLIFIFSAHVVGDTSHLSPRDRKNMTSNNDYTKTLIAAMEAKAVSDLVNEKKSGAKVGNTRVSVKTKHECLVQLGSTMKINTLAQRVNREFKKIKVGPPDVMIKGAEAELSSLSSSSNTASNSGSPPAEKTAGVYKRKEERGQS